MESRWGYLEDRIDRSAWIAAVMATVCFIIMIFVSRWLKKRMDDEYDMERKKQDDREKGIYEGSQLGFQLFRNRRDQD